MDGNEADQLFGDGNSTPADASDEGNEGNEGGISDEEVRSADMQSLFDGEFQAFANQAEVSDAAFVDGHGS
eukprot:s5285_g1.t1